MIEFDSGVVEQVPITELRAQQPRKIYNRVLIFGGSHAGLEGELVQRECQVVTPSTRVYIRESHGKFEVVEYIFVVKMTK